MIDSLPLDLFGEDEPGDEPVAEAPATAVCLWCSAEVAADARICHACGARLVPVEPPEPRPHEGMCQWCSTEIAPGDDACPSCGWDAQGDSEITMPGVTTPLSETQIRSLYGGDEEQEPGADDAVSVVAEVLSLILRHS